jgi:hypothetical protein
MRNRTVIALALVVTALVGASPALAQAPTDTTTTTATTTTEGGTTTTTVETTTAQALPPAPKPQEEQVPRLDERTAFLVGRNTLKLGILAFEYGILRQLSIGSDPPAWAARAVMDVLIPNVHLKFQFLDRDPIWLSLLVAAYYARLDKNGVDGHLIDVPISLFATAKAHSRFYLHGEATYIFARVQGTGDLSKAQFNGGAPIRAGQLGLMLQYRVTRIFSLTATGRYQAYVADIPFEGSSSVDPYTTATMTGQLTPGVKHPWEVIGGVAVLWKHFHMILGAGYGYYFIPGMNIANTSKTFVPDVSLAVVL